MTSTVDDEDCTVCINKAASFIIPFTLVGSLRLQRPRHSRREQQQPEETYHCSSRGTVGVEQLAGDPHLPRIKTLIIAPDYAPTPQINQRSPFMYISSQETLDGQSHEGALSLAAHRVSVSSDVCEPCTPTEE